MIEKKNISVSIYMDQAISILFKSALSFHIIFVIKYAQGKG